MTSIEGGQYRCGLEDNAIKFNFIPDDEEVFRPQDLSIQFKRTIRVPDNVYKSELPPDLGEFPLFKVHDYVDNLPPEITARGGVFLPMYQKEAMWLNFTANVPFMIKIYVGGVNVVSGEHYKEDAWTKSRRLELLEDNESIQDYVVVPEQPWLDGIATSAGVVRQFVAMPMGEGYSVEAQLTGEENVGGLQFEITPTRPRNRSKEMQVFVEDLTGQCVAITCEPSDTIGTFREELSDLIGIPSGQMRLVWAGQILNSEGVASLIQYPSNVVMDASTLSDCGIKDESTVYMVLRILGGGGVAHGIAAGGLIKQNIRQDTIDVNRWMKEMTVTIPVQILNSAVFRQVTGTDPPPCPIDASAYAEAGYAFFKMFEEPGNISGNFDAVKSINEIEQERGIAHTNEGSVHPRLVLLDHRGNRITIPTLSTLWVHDPDALMNPDGPLRPFRTVTDLHRDLGGSSHV